MINVLIPACGSSTQFESSFWPQNCIEINGKPMIQYVIDNFKSIRDHRFVTVLSEDECDRFHTDNMVKLFSDNNVKIVKLTGKTGGALCTTLMAIDYIENDDELLISNNDHSFDCDVENIISDFRKKGVDSGVVTFECVHPRWSYVRMEGENVVEAAEKRPISKRAIAGLYYFKCGRDYVESAKRVITKNKSYDGKYYISAAINEMILMGKTVGNVSIDSTLYHTFYEPKQIEKYETEVRKA